MLFYEKGGGSSTKVATVRKDVEGIFTLIEKNSFGRVGNFETKKILQSTKVFSFEV